MIHYFDTYATPFGPFSIAVHADGAVAATAFGGADALQSRLKGELVREANAPAAAAEELMQYCSGERRRFDLRLRAVGSIFQQRVWTALCEIPWGETRSYGVLARELGSSARAIGRANATNPICLIVPCHRVIGADGSLTGFAFGEAIKRQLLDHETFTAKALNDGPVRRAIG